MVTADYTGTECPTATEQGVSVEVEGSGTKKYVCDGEEGPEGPSWWPAGGTLPPNKTETGSWMVIVATTYELMKVGMTNISFPIPLNEDIPADHVRKVGPSETAPSECNDDVAPPPSFDRPEADPGYLCVFTSQFLAGGSISFVWKMDTPLSTTGDTGAGRTGALLVGTSSAEDVGTGTFALTAP